MSKVSKIKPVDDDQLTDDDYASLDEPYTGDDVIDELIEEINDPNEIETLRTKLKIVELQLKQAKEDRCIDALNNVLIVHNCSLKSLDGGNFECEWMG